LVLKVAQLRVSKCPEIIYGCAEVIELRFRAAVLSCSSNVHGQQLLVRTYVQNRQRLATNVPENSLTQCKVMVFGPAGRAVAIQTTALLLLVLGQLAAGADILSASKLESCTADGSQVSIYYLWAARLAICQCIHAAPTQSNLALQKMHSQLHSNCISVSVHMTMLVKQLRALIGVYARCLC
jgi:hypothetical protein